jgi:Fur family peroxide stress response transcriptional regulator
MNTKRVPTLKPERIRKALEALRKQFRAEGLRMTPQRMVIFEALLVAADHPSCEDLVSRLRPDMPSLSLDTVYRTVGTLERAGVLRKVATLEGVQRFDANLDPHHHFLCDTCHRIWDFPWESFDRLPAPEAIQDWMDIRVRQAELKGICGECLKSKSPRPVRAPVEN